MFVKTTAYTADCSNYYSLILYRTTIIFGSINILSCAGVCLNERLVQMITVCEIWESHQKLSLFT